MCGIVACLHDHQNVFKRRLLILKCAKKIRHRGPDSSGIHVQETPKGNNLLVHERLAIVNPESGEQPLFNKDKSLCLCANGEIYNHNKIRAEELSHIEFSTKSDCEVIVFLYEKFGTDCVKMLDGMFTFIISDSKTGDFLVARDSLGVISLYYGYDAEGGMWISSELKAINEICVYFNEFPPGHYYSSVKNEFVCYYNPAWFIEKKMSKGSNCSKEMIHNRLLNAIDKTMMVDVPYGVLLSGGLNSSIIAAVVNRYIQNHLHLGILLFSGHLFHYVIGTSRLHTFSVGFENSSDILFAKKVANFLGTIHHSFELKLQEGLDVISDVIHHLETYDVNTIRASIPLYLMARKIKSMGIKMVLTGDAVDDVFGFCSTIQEESFLQNHYQKTINKIKSLHSYDCLRTNKISSSWGLEARVPLLDTELLEMLMTIDPKYKVFNPKEKDNEGHMFIEKYLLRQAFECPKTPWLPHEILWREKVNVIDGVGSSWIKALEDHAGQVVSDLMFANVKTRFPYNPPVSKEAYFYRNYFELHFPQQMAASLHSSAELALKD